MKSLALVITENLAFRNRCISVLETFSRFLDSLENDGRMKVIAFPKQSASSSAMLSDETLTDGIKLVVTGKDSLTFKKIQSQ